MKRKAMIMIIKDRVLISRKNLFGGEILNFQYCLYFYEFFLLVLCLTSRGQCLCLEYVKFCSSLMNTMDVRWHVTCVVNCSWQVCYRQAHLRKHKISAKKRGPSRNWRALNQERHFFFFFQRPVIIF